MKKICLVCLTLVFGLFLTGCETTKTLECSTIQTQEGMDINQKVVAIFEKNMVTKMSLAMDIKVNKEYVPYIDSMKKSLEDQYATYKKEGVTIDITNTDDTIKAILDFNIFEMSEEDKEELDLVDIYGTAEATKQTFIEQGYTCK